MALMSDTDLVLALCGIVGRLSDDAEEFIEDVTCRVLELNEKLCEEDRKRAISIIMETTE